MWYDRLKDKIDAVEQEMKAVRPEARIDVTPGYFVPGLQT